MRRAARSTRKCRQTPARGAADTTAMLEALLSATGGVKSNADNDEYDGKHSNGSDDFHGYNSLPFLLLT